MTKQGLNNIEAWLRVLGLSILAGIGFVLLLHDLDVDVTTWPFSLLARVAGAGVMYLTCKIGKALKEWGMLPKMMYEDELDGAGRESEVSERSEVSE